ncbi:MAG TPA: type II toxin-antitoxin system VapC family toxin [Thermoanaerobaculia bacterium]|nr:type II toxin-antitoxin system VapC family toxin [Thermoanaerobaculia bacterium]
MIVVDASVVVQFLFDPATAERVARRAARSALHAPELLDLEVLQVLRRYRLRERLPAGRAMQAVSDFADLRIERHPHRPLRERIWELHRHLTAYDAAYVALSEALDAPLLTLDERLARSRGHRAVVELLRS